MSNQYPVSSIQRKASSRATRYHGFTLIEMIAASAIAVMVMGGILVVIARLNRSKTVLMGVPYYPVEVRAAMDLIRRDVEHAQLVEVEKQKITLRGLDGQGTHRPVAIEYRFAESCLVREAKELDRLDNQNTERELVLAGVEAFDVEAVSEEKLRVGITMRGVRHEGWIVRP